VYERLQIGATQRNATALTAMARQGRAEQGTAGQSRARQGQGKGKGKARARARARARAKHFQQSTPRWQGIRPAHHSLNTQRLRAHAIQQARHHAAVVLIKAPGGHGAQTDANTAYEPYA